MGGSREATTCSRSTGGARIRIDAEAMGRPEPYCAPAGTENLTYRPQLAVGLPDAASPPMCSKSCGRSRRTSEVPDASPRTAGSTVTAQRLGGGYGLYLHRSSTPHFGVPFSLDRSSNIHCKARLHQRKTKLVVIVAMAGGSMGKGGEVDDDRTEQEEGRGRPAGTIDSNPVLRGGCGHRNGHARSPIDFTCKLPFASYRVNPRRVDI